MITKSFWRHNAKSLRDHELSLSENREDSGQAGQGGGHQGDEQPGAGLAKLRVQPAPIRAATTTAGSPRLR
jgi:hypothetical protein